LTSGAQILIFLACRGVASEEEVSVELVPRDHGDVGLRWPKLQKWIYIWLSLLFGAKIDNVQDDTGLQHCVVSKGKISKIL